jgi:hypothetical protein
MPLLKLLVALTVFFLFTFRIFSHGGDTDRYGGHYQRSTGTYHFHHGMGPHDHPNGQCPYDQPVVKSTPSEPEQPSWTTNIIAMIIGIGVGVIATKSMSRYRDSRC